MFCYVPVSYFEEKSTCLSWCYYTYQRNVSPTFDSYASAVYFVRVGFSGYYVEDEVTSFDSQTRNRGMICTTFTWSIHFIIAQESDCVAYKYYYLYTHMWVYKVLSVDKTSQFGIHDNIITAFFFTAIEQAFFISMYAMMLSVKVFKSSPWQLASKLPWLYYI